MKIEKLVCLDDVEEILKRNGKPSLKSIFDSYAITFMRLKKGCTNKVIKEISDFLFYYNEVLLAEWCRFDSNDTICICKYRDASFHD